jgi:hypothetical protein
VLVPRQGGLVAGPALRTQRSAAQQRVCALARLLPSPSPPLRSARRLQGRRASDAAAALATIESLGDEEAAAAEGGESPGAGPSALPRLRVVQSPPQRPGGPMEAGAAHPPAAGTPRAYAADALASSPGKRVSVRASAPALRGIAAAAGVGLSRHSTAPAARQQSSELRGSRDRAAEPSAARAAKPEPGRPEQQEAQRGRESQELPPGSSRGASSPPSDPGASLYSGERTAAQPLASTPPRAEASPEAPAEPSPAAPADSEESQKVR